MDTSFISAANNEWIRKGHPRNRPPSSLEFPCVYIALGRDSEQVAQLGRGTQRWMRPSIEIICAARREPSASGSLTRTAEEECAILCNNVRTALRGDVTLSNTVASSVLDSVEYNANVEGFQSGGVYVSAAVMVLHCEKLST
jgi:hypothetical protein